MFRRVDPKFSPEALHVLALAEQEARGLNHEYIGTEHLLLGLVCEPGLVSDALGTLGVEALQVRREIDRLVLRGPSPVTAEKLPQTPRAKQAIEFAHEDALLLDDGRIQPEHLLMGLLREPDGVAGRVLKSLGISPERAGAEVFKVRLLQLKIVERAVRPVRAGIHRKRKMREELLAHLTAIYDDELSRQKDAVAAVKAAARRFGDPAELSCELQHSVPTFERVTAGLDHWLGWRAPETAQRWMLRLAMLLLMVLAATSCLVISVVAALVGFDNDGAFAIRPAIALVVMTPVAVFILGVTYFKIRDAMFGVFGSRKSLFRVLTLGLEIALVVMVFGAAFVAIADWGVERATRMLLPYGIVGIVTAATIAIIARRNGPTEIRDTLWACLDIDESSGDASLYAS